MGDEAKNEITVKVTVTGGESEDVTLAPGATVADALDAYGTEMEDGDKVYVGGEEANAETVLSDGAQVALVPPVSGGK